MIYTPNNILTKAKAYCYEAEHYSIEELTGLDNYIKTYVDSMEFIDGKRELKFKRADLLDQIENKQLQEIYKTTIFSFIEKGFTDYKNLNLNQSIHEFIINDNGYSVDDFSHFKKGLYKHIKDDLFVLFENVQRVIDKKVEDYHEIR